MIGLAVAAAGVLMLLATESYRAAQWSAVMMVAGLMLMVLGV